MDYNTRYNCHYYQEYEHVSKNCIRTHFRSNSKRWLSQTTCFSCLKTGHVSKNCPTGQNHLAVNSIKEKERLMLKKSKCRWTRHGRKRKIVVHQALMGSLHPMDHMITPFPTRKLRGMYVTNISKFNYTSVSRIELWKNHICMN